MRALLISLLLLLAGCTSGGEQATPDSAVRAALDVLAAGINAEDAVLASQPIGDQFFLGPNVGTRFLADPWESVPEAGRFRNFFSRAFLHLANESLSFTVDSVQINGDLATALVQTRFDAVRTDSTPAENVTYSTSDYMLFERVDGGWRLTRWDEQPVPTPEV